MCKYIGLVPPKGLPLPATTSPGSAPVLHVVNADLLLDCITWVPEVLVQTSLGAVTSVQLLY